MILSRSFVSTILEKKGGWARTRAIVSRPLTRILKMWSPYRNESKWHLRLIFFADISVNFDDWVYCNRKDCEPRKFKNQSFPMIIFDSRNVCRQGETKDAFTVYRQKRGEQVSGGKKIYIFSIEHPPALERRLPGHWGQMIQLVMHGPYVATLVPYGKQGSARGLNWWEYQYVVAISLSPKFNQC